MLEAFCSAKHFVNSVMSSRGKYNVSYRVLREVVENVVQLAGIFSTAMTRDVDAVSMRTMLLSLNFVCLPAVALWAYVVSGPIVAKMNVVLWEALFDRLFIALGVVLQLTHSDSLQDSRLGAQLIEHVPSLLPALFYCAFPKTALMVSSPASFCICSCCSLECLIAHVFVTFWTHPHVQYVHAESRRYCRP